MRPLFLLATVRNAHAAHLGVGDDAEERRNRTERGDLATATGLERRRSRGRGARRWRACSRRRRVHTMWRGWRACGARALRRATRSRGGDDRRDVASDEIEREIVGPAATSVKFMNAAEKQREEEITLHGFSASSAKIAMTTGVIAASPHGANVALAVWLSGKINGGALFEHDLIRKPDSTFRDHALRHVADGLDLEPAIHRRAAGLHAGARRQRLLAGEVAAVDSVELLLLALVLAARR